ncbi:glycosyltransferase family 39 protein [Gemmata sp.]|uniref:glycosyltransferase family 39 protein n=1 Tax=Gemmata sp. TaxID=1914242 RepID=UPI003F72B627
MSAEVGGQLEVVPARRSLFGPDYVRLAVLVLVGIGVHAWLIAHTAVPARDSLGFARYALNLSDPHPAPESSDPRQRIDVIRTAEQPPAYPAAIWATELVLRAACGLPTPDRALLATQVANAAAGVLLIVPMYLTGRMLFGRNVGFAGALLFQVLPVPARVTSDGLSEGTYLLASAAAITLGVRAARRPTIGGFLVCGLAVGASYLARPEGLLTGMAVGLVACAAGLARLWPRDAALGRLAALGVGVALVAVPYVVLIGKLTNKSTPGAIMNPWETPRIWQGQPSAAAAPAEGLALFGAWWDPKEDEGKNRLVWAAAAVWTEVIKAVHYVVGTLTLIAIGVHRRRLFAGDLGLWVPVALSGLSLLLMFFLAARVGYVSERHTVLLVMLCCVLGASAIGPVVRGLARVPVLGRVVVWPAAAPATFLAVLVASALPYSLKSLHPQREGHKHAGRWLAAHMAEGDWLQDPLAWAEWYAGRTLYQSTHYSGRPEYVWIVLERGKVSPHSRLPQWEEARQRAAGRAPVYRWPEDAPESGPAVEVYKVPFADLAPR